MGLPDIPETEANVIIDKDPDLYGAIRRIYVPSVVLAYISARVFASRYLGPETLISALDVATVLALDENAALADDFAVSGLLRTFVEAMAHCSRTLLRLNQQSELEEERQRQAERAVAEQNRKAGGDHAMPPPKKKKPSKQRSVSRGRFWVGGNVDVFDPRSELDPEESEV
jgi:hypothetical protein